MDKAEHTEMSTRHTELYIVMKAWGKPGGYTYSNSDILTHTVLYLDSKGISRYIQVQDINKLK
jgi:hypothetical protein